MKLGNKIRCSTLLEWVALIAFLLNGSRAQQSSFVWGFNQISGNQFTLPQCQSLSIYFNGDQGTVRPTPPYFMLAYEPNGTSTWSALGADTSNMAWIVNHAAGKGVMLGMADSAGNSGGLTTLNSIVGDATPANSSCLPTPNSNAPSMTSNATTSLNTCDIVKLSITGGTKPYTVTVVVGNAPAPYNTTMGANDDTYMWVNNLTPGSGVLLAVSDANELYALSTPLITLTGSKNTRCPQSSSSSSSSGSSTSSSTSSSPTSSSGSDSSPASKSKTGIIAGIIVAVLVLGLFGFIAWFFLFRGNGRNRNRRNRNSGVNLMDAGKGFGGRYDDENMHAGALPPGSNPTPYMYDGGEADRSSRSLIGVVAGAGGATRLETDSGEWNPYSDRSPVVPSPSTGLPPTSPSDYASGSAQRQSSYSATYSSRSGTNTTRGGLLAVNSDFNPSPWAQTQTSRDSKMSRLAVGARPDSQAVSERTVYQHQDGGSVAPAVEEPTVEEIPPAYPGPEGAGGSGPR